MEEVPFNECRATVSCWRWSPPPNAVSTTQTVEKKMLLILTSTGWDSTIRSPRIVGFNNRHLLLSAPGAGILRGRSPVRAGDLAYGSPLVS